MAASLPYLRTLMVLGLLGFLLCMALIFCGCASSSLGKGLNIGVAASAAADVVTTQQALSQGHREANPIMAGSTWRQALVKSAGVGVVIGLAHWVDAKQRPVLAHVVRVVYIAVNVGVAVSNAGVVR